MEKYHPSSAIQDFVFQVRKGVISGVFLCRYIINSLTKELVQTPLIFDLSPLTSA